MAHLNKHTININSSEQVSDTTIEQFYPVDTVQKVLTTTLNFITQQQKQGLVLPYFSQFDVSHDNIEDTENAESWQSKPKELDIYLTDMVEGRELNLEARGKNYATNILSYPSELPDFVLQEMPTIPLGELVICHEVVETQAKEQHKAVNDHVTHLIVHGILHLLGFDHELGQAEQDEMEGFEIEILKLLNIANPYLEL